MDRTESNAGATAEGDTKREVTGHETVRGWGDCAAPGAPAPRGRRSELADAVLGDEPMERLPVDAGVLRRGRDVAVVTLQQLPQV